MEIKTFWTIVLKGIGLWLILNCLYIFPQITATLLTPNLADCWDMSAVYVGFSLLAFFVYIVIALIFIFKSTFFISILKLERHFQESRIDISISSQSVLQIISILFGGIVILNSFPSFVKEMFEFAQRKELLRNAPNLCWIVYYGIMSMLGYLLIMNSSFVAKVINKKVQK